MNECVQQSETSLEHASNNIASVVVPIVNILALTNHLYQLINK